MSWRVEKFPQTRGLAMDPADEFKERPFDKLRAGELRVEELKSWRVEELES